jgi:hypothetical protein
MEIYWISTKLKNNLENEGYLSKEFDPKVAKKVAQRLKELGSATSYAQLPPATGKHPIREGKKFLYFAVDIPGKGEGRGKLRLLFRPYGEHDLAHIETITAIVIISLEDYH